MVFQVRYTRLYLLPFLDFLCLGAPLPHSLGADHYSFLIQPWRYAHAEDGTQSMADRAHNLLEMDR